MVCLAASASRAARGFAEADAGGSGSVKGSSTAGGVFSTGGSGRTSGFSGVAAGLAGALGKGITSPAVSIGAEIAGAG